MDGPNKNNGGGLMQKLLLKDMTCVELLDRDGNMVSIEVDLYQYQETVAVFLSETAESPGAVARNSATLIEQLQVMLDLDVMNTTFLRHVAMASVGSLFGRFKLTWRGNKVVSYTFSMISGLGDEKSVSNILKEGIRLPVVEVA